MRFCTQLCSSLEDFHGLRSIVEPLDQPRSSKLLLKNGTKRGTKMDELIFSHNTACGGEAYSRWISVSGRQSWEGEASESTSALPISALPSADWYPTAVRLVVPNGTGLCRRTVRSHARGEQSLLSSIALLYFKIVAFYRSYKNLAIGVLGECYSSDQHKVALLVVRPMKNFHQRTPLQLAALADDKEFVAHPACQSVLTSIWFGTLRDDTSHLNLKVSVSDIFVTETKTLASS